MGFLWSTLTHHDEIPDAAFLEWIKAQLDHFITLEPWAMVAVLGVIVLAIPVAIIGFYLYQQRRTNYLSTKEHEGPRMG